MSYVSIRRAVRGDEGSVAELYSALLARNADEAAPGFKFALDDPGVKIFVAECDGALVGACAISVRHVVRYNAPIAEIDELVVAPRARRRGVGRCLVRAADEAAREWGCNRLYVATSYRQPMGPLLYEQAGFEDNGHHYRKSI